MASQLSERGLGAAAKARGVRLLVIDDSPTIRKLVELSFRSTEVEVDFASTGSDGVARALRDRPDVILLDYVLPDMKGSDVCRRIVRDPRGASIPVLVMSAKGQNVSDLFAGIEGARSYIAKPFSADDIVARVRAISADRAEPSSVRADSAVTPPPSRTEAGLAFAQKQALASAIFSRLRPALARIPEWYAELGSSAPASFFARKLLTPALIDGLLEEVSRTLGATGAPLPAAGSGARFEGDLAGWSALAILRALDASRTGEITFTTARDRTVAYVRAGEIVLVSTFDPARYREGVDLDGVPADLIDRAEAEQRASGKPLFVHLVENGAALGQDLGSLLLRQGKRALMEVIAADRLRFSWRDRAAFPLYVEAHARRIPLAQIVLERAREGALPELAGAPPPAIDRVYERAPLFSHKVHDLELTSGERRLLSAIDGRRAADDLARRADLPAVDTLAMLHRLAAVDLIRVRAGGRAALGAPRVLLLEPDVAGVERPLASLLQKCRPQPLTLQPLSPGEDVREAVAHVLPRLVIVNAAVCDAPALSRAVRADERLARVRLSAVLDLPDPATEDELLSAGFDVVWVKPFSWSDVERLLRA